MLYVLNLSEDNRILSACIVLSNINYKGMPIVKTLPNGDVTNYLFIDGKYIYDPLPTNTENIMPTVEERIKALEDVILDMILGGEDNE